MDSVLSQVATSVVFVLGALLGGGVVHFVTSSARWGRYVAAALALVCTVVMITLSVFARPALLWSLLVEDGALAGALVGGLFVGLLGEILYRLVGEPLGLRLSWGNLKENRKRIVRGVLIVGGLLLALVALLVVLFALLALISYLTAWIMG